MKSAGVVRRLLTICSAAVVLTSFGARLKADPVMLHIGVDRRRVAMGRTVFVYAEARTAAGAPRCGLEVWPCVNGRRWGAEAVTDRQGRAVLPLPLPNPGVARIQVVARADAPVAVADWIWASTVADGQTVWFRRRFDTPAGLRRAVLRIACDDQYQAFLNGVPIARGTTFQHMDVVRGLERRFEPGGNELMVEARNGVGPAGLLARLEMETPRGTQVVATDARWEVFGAAPTGGGEGRPAAVQAPVGGGAWGAFPKGWPGLTPRRDFPVGLPAPIGAPRSNALTVQVIHRTVARPPRDPGHLVGMEWEPWFTPLNMRWETAQAVPVLGRYDSFQPDVIRQHALWMTEAGIDFLLVDWTNNLWDRQHWRDHAPGVDELIRGTTAMLDVYAGMRREGIPVPAFTLILGLDNGPQTTTTALSEQMTWIYDHYVAAPRYRGLWMQQEGKPLILLFNGGGPAIRAKQPPISETRFTVRWMSSQLQFSHLDRQGYWSWMDGVLEPPVTYREGRPEAVTVTPAFFGDGGWTYPQARGRRGGATYLQTFDVALRARPRYTIINQWNEFAGQPDGQGYGPKRDQYVDCYSPELSDDIEPTSLVRPAYRGKGGWGYYDLNLTRALIALYHQRPARDTLLSVASPARGEAVRGRRLEVEWAVVGAPPASITLLLDGRVVARDVSGNRYSLDLNGVRAGPHTLVVRAEGVTTHFALSRSREDEPVLRPVGVQAAVEFTYTNGD